MPVVPDGRADLPAPSGALKAEVAHQPGDRAADHGYALALQLAPYLPDAVDAEVVGVDAADLRLQLDVAHRSVTGRALPGV